MSGRKSIEKAIAVIESGGDEGVDEYFSCGLGEGGTEAGYVTKVKEGCFSDMVNV